MTITNAAAAATDSALAAARLTQALRDARERTLALVSDLDGAQLLGPKLAIVNPPLWEVGHLGWFQERWCLRYRDNDALGPSRLRNADALYDSAAVAHDTRWDLPLPTLEATLQYLAQVLENVLERLDGAPTAELIYFAELAAAHEEMHCEAFTYTRQTLGYAAPRTPHGATSETAGPHPGDVELSGGPFMLGAEESGGFVFDNEKWAHPVEVASFRMARAAVTNDEYAAFVDDGGYLRRELWCDAGWAWRAVAAATRPAYWHKHDGAWFERRYDVMKRLSPHRPVVHVNWFEAQAYCRWAGRRLPSEAEWEYAAATSRAGAPKRDYPWGDAAPDASHANFHGVADRPLDVSSFAAGDSAAGCRQMMGNVWEWTADTFAPYPGFVRDPYKEYSEPWFGTHKVLRGGSFATRGWLMRNTWRNFYTPDRRDIYAGFRTCAAEADSPPMNAWRRGARQTNRGKPRFPSVTSFPGVNAGNPFSR